MIEFSSFLEKVNVKARKNAYSVCYYVFYERKTFLLKYG